jgi:ATP-dependent DNA helicase PIF1
MSQWKKSKGLILDEVSMLSKKIFEILEELARIIKKSSAPFGGMQIVFSGDFFQLPPIGTDGEPDTEEFCFESPIWNRVFKKENMVELTTMFRQTDPLYIGILNQIRKGELDETSKHTLQKYVNREYDSAAHNGCVPTKLFALRSKTDYINNMMFSKLNEKEYSMEILTKKDCNINMDSKKPIDLALLQKCSQLTETEIEYELEQLTNNTPCSKIFRFKKGAVVMCTVNLDMEQSICNGSQGTIIDILETGQISLPVVKFSNGIVKTIQPYFWQSENHPTIAIGQFPLCLAWAITIHKIQGSTLSIAEMDIGYSIFEYGQTYVALSRIQSLDGLYLSSFHPDKIKANPKVIEFYNSIENINMNNIILDIKPLPIESDKKILFSDYKYKESSNTNTVSSDSNIKILKI